MLAEMSSEEFAYWQQLEVMEPFGERANYLRQALLCALVSNMARPATSTPANIDDFMPPTMKEETLEQAEHEGPSPEQFRALMFAVMEHQNAWLSTQEGGAHA